MPLVLVAYAVVNTHLPALGPVVGHRIADLFYSNHKESLCSRNRDVDGKAKTIQSFKFIFNWFLNHQSDLWPDTSVKGETVVAALVRLDGEIAKSEKVQPAARLAVITAELESIQQEIKTFEESTNASPTVSKETYAKTLHQEMRRLELSWLRVRYAELQKERRGLHAQILRTRSLYAQLQHLTGKWKKGDPHSIPNRVDLFRIYISYNKKRCSRAQWLASCGHQKPPSVTKNLLEFLCASEESIWSDSSRPGTPLEEKLSRACALRDALASVSARLRAAAEYAHAAARLVDDAMPAWKMTAVGKSGWDRTLASADACTLLVQARCLERGARRVLSAPAAPRAARSLRLALDYAFTDIMHDHKYKRATETFMQFKEALVQLINSIHQEWQLHAKTIAKGVKKPLITVEIFINGKSVTVPNYFTILQALRRERVTIPSFCYHERLSIAGNCRMCLIEVEGMFKPQIACAMPVSKGMKIRTNSEVALRAQESVLEFLLINHPLDCPICDQGGECDLQDLSMRFGNDRSRFTDVHFMGKRAVEDKNLGPLVRTEMTRCIHCTRCIRFGMQVCGMDVLGTAGRGTDMLVGTYVDKMFLSELSGNIIDLCPVGALTSIPYMFKARPWEVKRTNSIDVTDATGTNIVLNYRYDRLLRVLPREHEEINQEWLSDKGRWAIDSLEMQRLVTPMRRNQACLVTTEWDVILRLAGKIIACAKPESVMAVAGPHCNVETLVTCKDFLNMLGSEHTYIERGLYHTISGGDLRAAYSLNINMKDIAQADKILLIGTNPRFEAPVLNARIRQAYMNNECDIYVIGPECEYNYHVNYLGSDLGSISKATQALRGAKNPLIFIGIAQAETAHGGNILNKLTPVIKSFLKVPPNWNIINFITREASFAGALEAGWKCGGLEAVHTLKPTVLISLGADEIFYDWKPPTTCTVIYIGFQGDRGSEVATAILPGSAYTEAGGIFLNMEGRSQYAMPAVTPPGKARHDWKILRALAEYSGICLYYSDHNSLCCRLAEISPNFTNLGKYQEKVFCDLIPSLANVRSCDVETLDVDMKVMKDYYCTDVFTYNSPTMIKTQKAATQFATSSYAAI
ncbi:unnamed protein product [Diatraea saccharalis]|uniref:NADH-ubiquinone oxidoreductase 75 kDa subunit, mitochondrial n=1 Tax=Diatraea saccharalis TaxID=40085 RepID=A0A9N9WDH4_9NEOP|nr:unnamed protein product [Diatraea saccharalis]